MSSAAGPGCPGLRVLLLGVGRQGRAALLDLVASGTVAEVVAADRDHDGLAEFARDQGLGHKVRCERVDAGDAGRIDSLVGAGVDVVVDLLPVALHDVVSEAVVRRRVHLVNASYASPLLRGLGDLAAERDLTLLPELGLDPGIDLVLLGEAVRGLDSVQSIRSYAAGFPELGSEDNPLRYKVTWTLEGVLRSYRRAATVIRSGARVSIPDTEVFSTENVHEIDVERVGRLEAFPNGDVLEYLALLGLESDPPSEAGRYVLRWPGHSAFWKRLVDLHLLDDGPVTVDGLQIDRRRFLASALEPYLQYGDGERDVAVVRVEVLGRLRDRKVRVVLQVDDRRDLETGLYAMNRTVGYSASIGALLIGDGTITGRGLLSPVKDVPFDAFARELERRGIRVTCARAPLE